MSKKIPTREQLESTYKDHVSDLETRLEKAKEELLFLLKYENCPVKYLYVSGRVKSFESLYAKTVIMRMPDPLNDMEDLLGLRIVCLYRSDISELAKFIEATSRNVTISQRRRRSTSDDTFGYDAQHYIMTHSDWFRGKDEKTRIELQIRTILMDAWAFISHDLDYKKEIDIPSSRKRDFYALSATLYSIDSQFELLRNERQKYAKEILKDFLANRISKKLELNRENLALYCEAKFPEVETPDYAIEIIEQSLRSDGILTIKDLHNILSLTSAARLDPELNDESTHYEPIYVIGQVVLAVVLHDISLCEKHLINDPEKKKATIEKYKRIREKYGLANHLQVSEEQQ